jgi:alkanesulfonate monooxygenase SsuD/methylene tetrahydromethanopterin reductase-like flavin-dependent oxidoreductase (luciferase family)
VGWLAEEFAALGVPFQDRGERTDEYVAAMRALWNQERASFKGRFVSFDDVFCRPLPPGRRVPIIVGGDTKAAARRAGRLGDGYFPARTPAPELLDEMRGAAVAAGRNPRDVEITVAARRRSPPSRLLRSRGSRGSPCPSARPPACPRRCERQTTCCVMAARSSRGCAD